MPDFLRIPLVAGYSQRLSQSIRIFLQTSADSLNRKEIEGAQQVTETRTIPLPAITSKFLVLYNEKRELSETLDALREEFREHRKAIVDWEQRMRESSLKEQRKVSKEISSSIESLKSVNETEIILNIDYMVGKDFLTSGSWLDTAATVVKEVYKMLKRQFDRRHVIYYYTSMKEANKIKDQPDLLKDTFGSQLTQGQSQRFIKLATRLNELTQLPKIL